MECIPYLGVAPGSCKRWLGSAALDLESANECVDFGYSHLPFLLTRLHIA